MTGPPPSSPAGMPAEPVTPADPVTPAVVVVDGTGLTCRQVRQVARGAQVSLARAGRDRAEAAWRVAVAAVAAGGPVYGRTTGVGANREATVGALPDDRAGHGWALLRSHAGGAGPAVPTERVRAMMVVRINQLAAGGAGVSPSMVDALVTALNLGLTPPVRRYGGLGTGDLTALATTALCLTGDRPWTSGVRALTELDPADALAFMSSNALATGTAAVSCADLSGLVAAATVVGSLSLLAVGGSIEPYAAAVHRSELRAGQRGVAEQMRANLAGQVAGPPRRIQDPYGYRALAQVHGTAVDAVAALDRTISAEMNHPTENPLVDATGAMVHHNGNFHAGALAIALDAARIALFQAAALSTARLANLLEPAHTGLTAFLAGGGAASSGLMILEYVAHAALADIRLDATPAALGSAVLSRGAEDHASFAAQAAERTAQVVEAYRVVLGGELVAAVRALRMAGSAPVTGPLADVYELAADALDPGTEDRPLDGDLDVAVALLDRLADVRTG